MATTEPASNRGITTAERSVDVRIALRINGVTRDLTIDPRVTLLAVLRVTGAKKGCDRGQHGAVHVDGRPRCPVFAQYAATSPRLKG